MPRHSRFVLPRVPLHIVHRGNNRQRCFWEEVDHRVYLRLLETNAAMARCEIHCFVLMPNHVHMLVTPQDADSPAKMMKGVAQNYSQYANRRMKRTGSLWEGRFWSGIVGEEAYVMKCQRYIELNPVRAKLVPSADRYRWSSFESNSGSCAPLNFLSPHAVFRNLGGSPEERKRLYRDFLATSPPERELEEIRAAVKGGFALGSPDFLERLKAEFGERVIRTRSRQQDRSSLLVFQ